MRWYDYWIIYILISLTSLVGFAGCRTIRPEDLSAECQKRLAAKDAEIVKLRTSKPTPLWPIYLISAIALVAGGAIGYFLGKVFAGILLAVGGAAAIGWMQFLERYPKAFWIPFALGIAFTLYMAWDWYRGVRSQKALTAIVPAIEGMGAGNQSALLKAAIENNAGNALNMVKAEVTAVKGELGI